MDTEKDASAYKNPDCSIEERTTDLIARMTLDEKLAQLGAVTPFENAILIEDDIKPQMKDGVGHISMIAGRSATRPRAVAEIANRIQRFLLEETRLGIPAIMHEECLSGFLARGATIFPQMIGAASSWEPELIAEMTTAIRTQMRAVGAHQGLSPVLDIARDPRWGRTEETFGEDPYLASTMAVSYVKGLQGPGLKHGIAATAKHFVGYSVSEGGLNWAPAKIMPRELREVFMMPFEAAVKEAKLASVMNAYHELDGIPCGASKTLLTEILRDEWGFDGVVVSDFFTVPMLTGYHRTAKNQAEAAAMALEAGLDIELPQTICYGQPLREAVAKGEVSAEVIDQAVARILTMKFKMGLFENPYVDIERVDTVFDTLEQRSLARTLARKSIVLLKNSENLLPLKKDISSIAVIGPNADNARHMLGDYSHPSSLEELGGDLGASQRNGLGPDLIGVSMNTLLGAVKERVASATSVHYAKGCEVLSDSKEGFAEAAEAAKESDVAIVVVGERSGTTFKATSGEFRDRADVGLPGVQTELVQAVCETGTPVVVVLLGGRPLSIPWITENVPAVVEAWLPGEEGGEAVSEVLFGDYNPGGKLPITIPRATGQIPIYYNHKPSGARSFHFADYVDLSCTPLFAFGHGLSYSRFEYSELRIEPERVDVDGEVQISLGVKNIGEREGEEVVQLYVHDAESNVTRPVKELRGFKRFALAPGEARNVRFTLFVNQLGFYDAEMRFVVEPGTIEVMVGSASDDIRLEGTFAVTGKATEISSSKVFFSTSEVE